MGMFLPTMMQTHAIVLDTQASVCYYQRCFKNNKPISGRPATGHGFRLPMPRSIG